MLVVAACGPGERAAREPAVRDSGGVRIVENVPADTAETWSLGDPVLEIGAVQGSVAYQMDGVGDVARGPDGAIIVAERGSRELSLFIPDGEFLRARTLTPPNDALSLRLLGVLESGNLVAAGSGGAGDDRGDGRFRRTVSLYRYGERFEIRCRSADGRLRTIIRDSVPRRPVTNEAVDRLVESRVGDIDRQEFRVRVRRAHEEVGGVPDVMPALDRILIDSEGLLWAGAYRPTYEEGPRQWLLFGPDGVRRARLHMPDGFTPHAIDDGRVAGRWEGEMGVDFVRVYRLRR